MNISTIVAVVETNTDFKLSSIVNQDINQKEIVNVTPTNFGNQVTIKMKLDKELNIKLFSNGKLQITGLKENYKEQIDRIINVIYSIGCKVNDHVTYNCIRNDLGVLCYKNFDLIGNPFGVYKNIGYVKKNSTSYIDGHKIIPFDLSCGILTTESHINYTKNLYNTNGLLIGKSEYIILGKYVKGACLSEIDKNNIIHLNDSRDEVIDPETYYYTKRNCKNLVIKNNKLLKYNDNLYILYKKRYQSDTPDLTRINDIYAFVKITFIEPYNNTGFTPNEHVTIEMKNYLYSNPDFRNNYSIKIANINTDLKLNKLHYDDQFNLYSIQTKFTELVSGSEQFTISYDPSKYSALKINFPAHETSIRIFKSFNCKFSSKSFDSITKLEKLLIEFINDHYNSIIYKHINIQNMEHLSLEDVL